MAVVTKYGTGARDPAAEKNIDNIFAGGNVRAIRSTISIANGDSIASLYKIGELPSNALLDPRGAYFYSAVTGVTIANIGIYKPDLSIITAAAQSAIVAADDLATAGNQTLIGHGTLVQATLESRLWQLVQTPAFTSDPGGNLALALALGAAATAAGTVVFILPYSVA